MWQLLFYVTISIMYPLLCEDNNCLSQSFINQFDIFSTFDFNVNIYHNIINSIECANRYVFEWVNILLSIEISR